MNSMFIGGAILFAGFLICLFLILRAQKKARGIIHYETIRDKLTLREEEPEEENITGEVSEYSGFGLGNLIGGFIVIFVGFSLFPIMKEEMNTAMMQSNITTASQMALTETAFTFAPIVFGVGITLIAINLVYRSLTEAGLI